VCEYAIRKQRNLVHPYVMKMGIQTRRHTSANDDGPQSVVLTFTALLTLLGKKSRQSIYDLMRRDRSFPRPRQFGSAFSIAWIREEVIEWLKSRPLVELDGLDAIERRKKARELASSK
jgi:predicted DNA-binding transcriptional regulator AlpA